MVEELQLNNRRFGIGICFDYVGDTNEGLYWVEHDDGKIAPYWEEELFEPYSDPQKSSRKICKICFKPNPVDFDVPDKVWNSVVSDELSSKVICLWCFIDLADKKMIAWDKGIKFYPISKITSLKD